MVLIKDIQLVDEVPYSGPERRKLNTQADQTATKLAVKAVAINIVGMLIGVLLGYIFAISK